MFVLCRELGLVFTVADFDIVDIGYTIKKSRPPSEAASLCFGGTDVSKVPFKFFWMVSVFSEQYAKE